LKSTLADLPQAQLAEQARRNKPRRSNIRPSAVADVAATDGLAVPRKSNGATQLASRIREGVPSSSPQAVFPTITTAPAPCGNGLLMALHNATRTTAASTATAPGTGTEKPQAKTRSFDGKMMADLPPIDCSCLHSTGQANKPENSL
jgi:hypothetical protein